MIPPTQTLANHLTYQQVQKVIQAFYQQLLAHPQLSQYFSHIKDFSAHEKRITDFWWLALGGRLDSPPRIDMINKHMTLGINSHDLHVWLEILDSTLDHHLTNNQAMAWKQKAHQIGARLKQVVIDKQPSGIQIAEPNQSAEP
jgi:hemoglobin